MFENNIRTCNSCSLTAICSLYAANNVRMIPIAEITNCSYYKEEVITKAPSIIPVRQRSIEEILNTSNKITKAAQVKREQNECSKCCKCDKILKEDEIVIDAMTSYVFCEECYKS